MISFLVVLVLGLASLALSSNAADCGKLPSWTIKDLKINSRDEVGSAGKAVFSFTDNQTGKSDALSCTLVANYRCQFDGTPSDPAVTINIQAMMEVMYISVTKKLTCDGAATKLVAGNADLEMNCTSVAHEDTSCSLASGDIQGVELAAAE